MTSGIFNLRDWGTVSVEGPDAADFLQRLSTADIPKLPPGQTVHAALLTGKANPIALGFLRRISPTQFLWVLPPGLAEKTEEYLERMHFAETLTVKRGDDAVFALLNLKSVEGIPLEGWADDAQPGLFWVTMNRSHAAPLEAKASLDAKLFETLRISAGVPRVGVELGEKDIILEGNFDRAVARNKGCYPGQEVVERIFTYGQVNRKLLKVEIESAEPPVAPFEVGKIRVVSVAPIARAPGKYRGLAFVPRALWDSKETFDGKLRLVHD